MLKSTGARSVLHPPCDLSTAVCIDQGRSTQFQEDRLGPLLPKEVEVRDYDRGKALLVFLLSLLVEHES